MKRKLLTVLLQEYTHLLELEQTLYDRKSEDPTNRLNQYQVSQTELKNLGIMIRKKMIALEDNLINDRVHHILTEIEKEKESDEVSPYGFNE